MKVTKQEIIWLACVVTAFALYNLPYFPPYYHPVMTVVHGVLTIGLLWISIYTGLRRTLRNYKLKEKKEKEEKETEERTC